MTDRIAALKAAAARKECGTHAKYVAGCRCVECTRANREYERVRAKAKARGQGNPMVDATAAREHLRALAAVGIGRRTVAAVTDLHPGNLWKIRLGLKAKVRRETERRILAVDEGARGDAARVDAKPAWRLIRELVRRGWTKGFIAQRLGCKAKALQLRRGQITARSAMKVERLYRAIEAGRVSR